MVHTLAKALALTYRHVMEGSEEESWVDLRLIPDVESYTSRWGRKDLLRFDIDLGYLPFHARFSSSAKTRTRVDLKH